MGEYQWSGSDNSDLGYLGNWFPLQGGAIQEPGPNDVAIIEFGPALTGTLNVGALDLIQQGPGEPALTITGASTQVTASSAGIGNTVTLDAGALLQVGTLSTAAGCTFLATGANTSVDVTSTLSLAGKIELSYGASLYAAALSIAGTSTVTVTAGATLFATVSTSNTMSIGSTAGKTTLLLTGGASANIMSYDTEGDLNVGDASGSQATLSITGQASLYSTPDNLVIGAGGSSSGLLYVDGVGSSAIFECWGTVFVGVAPGASGEVLVAGGGYLELDSDFGVCDITSDTSAKVIVTGAGSDLDAGPSVNIGGETVYEEAGSGELLVSAGATAHVFDHTELETSGALVVTGAGSVFQTSQIEIEGQASMQINAGGTVQAATCNLDGGIITLAGGTLALHADYDAQSGYLSGNGTLAAPRVINAGLLDAKGGTLVVTGAITGNGLLHIESGATLLLDSSAAVTQALTFESGANTLALADPSGFFGSIFDFAAGDAVDLLKTAATSLTYATGALSVFNGSTKVATLRLAGSYAASGFHLASDGHGGTDVTYAASAAIGAPIAGLGHHLG